MVFTKGMQESIRKIIDDAISSCDGNTIIVNDIAVVAWENARTMLLDQIETLALAYLKTRIRQILKEHQDPGSSSPGQPVLRGMESVVLPDWIAVPSNDTVVETDRDLDEADKNGSVSWVVTWKATGKDLRKNLEMRQKLINSSVAERNKINALYEAFKSNGGTDDDLVDVVLKSAPNPGDD